MRLFNGVAAAGLTLGVLATGMAVVNFTTRTWAIRRVHERPDDLNAAAVLYLF